MQQCLTAEELDMYILIAGELMIDIDNWQQFTQLEDFTNECSSIVWFWELVKSWDQAQLSKPLLFVTGHSNCCVHNLVTESRLGWVGAASVGPGGFEHLQGYSGQEHRFTIRRRDDGGLPRAQTCFNILQLPSYPTKGELEEKLALALEQSSTGGFDEGAVAE